MKKSSLIHGILALSLLGSPMPTKPAEVCQTFFWGSIPLFFIAGGIASCLKYHLDTQAKGTYEQVPLSCEVPSPKDSKYTSLVRRCGRIVPLLGGLFAGLGLVSLVVGGACYGLSQ